MPDKYDMPGNLAAVLTAPAVMLLPERLVLYSLIFGLRPKRYVEIGTFRGGSTVIACAAMDDVGEGKIVCIEPNPEIEPETWESIRHRAELVKGFSPDALSHAQELAGGPFDFAFIDGWHEMEGVLHDIEGVMSCLSDRAYLLFHDCHYHGVGKAIDEAVRLYSSRLHDFGNVSTKSSRNEKGRWGGMRLVLFTRETEPVTEHAKVLQAAQEQLRISREGLYTLEKALRASNTQVHNTQQELDARRHELERARQGLETRRQEAEDARQELLVTSQRLEAIEKSRTWRIGQKLALSWLGRALRWAERNVLRRKRPGTNTSQAS